MILLRFISFKTIQTLGFTGANNIGIEYAKSEGYEYIMLLNNDTEVDKNFIEPLLNRLNSRKENRGCTTFDSELS